MKVSFFTVLFLFGEICVCNGITINSCCPLGQEISFEGTTCKVSPNAPKTPHENLPFKLSIPNVGNRSWCAEGAESIIWIPRDSLLDETSNDYDYVDQTSIGNSGTLRYRESFYAPSQFCFASARDGNIGLKLCVPSCDGFGGIPCLPKCCLYNEVLSMEKFSFQNMENESSSNQPCIKSQIPFRPRIYTALDKAVKGQEETNLPDVHWKLSGTGDWNKSECKTITVLTYHGTWSGTELKLDFRIMNNGSVMVRGMNPKWRQLNTQFCIDGLANSETGFYSGSEAETVILTCFPPSDISIGADYHLGRVYYSILFVSASFLLLTILIYIILWDKHTIHGFCLLSYFISLFLMEVGYTASFLLSERSIFKGTNLIISPSCFGIGVMAHAFILWAFSWMTIVNFDLWCTFRNLKSTLTTGKGIRQYLKYFISALLPPIIIVIIGVTLDLNYGNEMPYDRPSFLIIPDYGKRKCYFGNPDSLMIYAIGPIGILLSVNLFFFYTTLWALRVAQEGTNLIRYNQSPNRMASFWIIVKLIVVMGVFWIGEVIATLAMYGVMDDIGSNSVPPYWIALDIFNHFQGVFIFIIFICKRDIWNSLNQQIPLLYRFSTWIGNRCHCCHLPVGTHRDTINVTLDSGDHDGRHAVPTAKLHNQTT